jgi:hypothetical protein
MRESHHYVGDLHAGVIDVVLDIDFPAGVTQQTDEGIAEDGVAQVADVGGLVGIDAGVLDQNFPAGMSAGGCRSAASAAAIQARSILTFK